MAGPNLHEKLHRANHHTLSSVGLPDSATDPIASPLFPFQGNFYLSGYWNNTQNISANGSSVFEKIEIINTNNTEGLYIQTNNKPAITSNSPISSNKVIYDYLYNSDIWNNLYSVYSNNKNIWHDLYNYTSSNSANFDEMYLYSLNLSATSVNWNSTHQTISTNAGNWNSGFSTISSVSAIWEIAFANYINWNAVTVPLVITKLSDWDSYYNTITNVSGIWQSTYNTINTLSSRWKSNHQTINSNQPIWDGNTETINNRSPFWDSLYNTLYNISGVDTPIGSVIAFAQNGIPDGWLKCNGASYSKQIYNLLFDKIGTIYTSTPSTTSFNVPDLRGLFIRGWCDDFPLASDTLKNRDANPKRLFGSYQGDNFQGHFHYFTKYSDLDGGLAGGDDMYSIATDGSGGFANFYNLTKEAYYDNGFGDPRNGFETRPSNIALLYCIKYK